MGEVWSMQNADTHAQWGERRLKGRKGFSYVNFSRLAIKYEFYFTKASYMRCIV